MWAFLHTKTGTAMTAVGSNPNFARASGINIDKTRMLSVIMSTWLAAVGILMYEQGFGFIQLYMAPFYMALPAVSAILIGGASVNKASITNVIIGTFLFQGIVTMTRTVMNSMIHMDMSEVIPYRCFQRYDSLCSDQEDGGFKMSKNRKITAVIAFSN